MEDAGGEEEEEESMVEAGRQQGECGVECDDDVRMLGAEDGREEYCREVD